MEKIENIKEIFKNESESQLKYLNETYDYYDLGSDDLVKNILEIRKGKKLSITSELYYDDEYTAPDKSNFEVFKRYNENNNKYYDIKGEANDYYYILSNYKNDKENYNLYNVIVFSKDTTKGGMFFAYCRNNKEYITPLNVKFDFNNDLTIPTQDNQELIKEIHDLILRENEVYNIRLEKYFKRYGKDHIRTCGYWANR